VNEDLVTTLLQTFGAPGLIAAIAIYGLRYLHGRLDASQEKRVADAQSQAAQLLKLAEEQHKQMAALTSAIVGSTRAIEASTDANQELRVVVERAVTSAPRGRTMG
jgi:uncharacterized membrane protein YciS (DUF1049 family)